MCGVNQLLCIEQLFSVYLGILVSHGTVAIVDCDQRETKLIKVTKTIFGNIPAEHAVAHLVILMTNIPPLLQREMAEKRQITAMLLTHR